MIKKLTTYLPENQSEIDHIENFESIQLELKLLKAKVLSLTAQNETKDQEIAILQARIIELEKQLADLQPEPPTPQVDIKLFYHRNKIPYPLENNYTIDQEPIAITAETGHGPVRFELVGTEQHIQNESVAPYALKGDASGNLNLWTPTAGEYKLKVTNGLNEVVEVNFLIKAIVVTPPVEPPSGELAFHGKMEEVKIGSGTYGTGLIGWENRLESLNDFRDSYLSESSAAVAKIIDINGRKALEATLNTPLNGARVQHGLVCADNLPHRTWKMSQEIMLHPDLAYASQYSGAIGGTPWFVVFETWMARVEEWKGDPPSRMNIGLRKNSGVGQPLVWELRNQFIQPSNVAYTNIYTPIEGKVPPIFGEIFTWEITIVEGEGDKGSFKVVQKQAGKPDVVVFDYKGTTIYPGRPDIKRGTFNPIKFYSHDNLVNFMKGAGKLVRAYFFDFKLWK